MKATLLITIIRNLPNQIIKWFEAISAKYWGFYCIVLFSVGEIINHATEFRFKFFTLHQVLLISATTMLVYAMKKYFISIDQLDVASEMGALKKVPEVQALYKNRLLPLQRTYWVFLVAVCITTFFFTCIVLLEYIQLDIIGVYAIYIGGTSVLIGVYGYMQYLFFLWFLYRIGKNVQFKEYAYNYYSPAKTEWIIQLAKISQRLRNYFLIIGLIYSVEYYILVPTDILQVQDNIVTMSTPNNIAFIVSWVALFILVIIAFPVLNHVQYVLVVNIVEKLKATTKHDISELMLVEQENSTTRFERLSVIFTYSSLITFVDKESNYPIKRHISYESILTLATFAVHCFNLLSKLSSIPQLSLLLNP